MAKAERSGMYTLNGYRYFVAKGDALPNGAVMDDPPEQRKEGPAPENRKQPEPENRGKTSKKDADS